jgi:hypothetical protein
MGSTMNNDFHPQRLDETVFNKTGFEKTVVDWQQDTSQVFATRSSLTDLVNGV